MSVKYTSATLTVILMLAVPSHSEANVYVAFKDSFKKSVFCVCVVLWDFVAGVSSPLVSVSTSSNTRTGCCSLFFRRTSHITRLHRWKVAHEND